MGGPTIIEGEADADIVQASRDAARAGTTTDDRDLHGASHAQLETHQVESDPFANETPTTADEIVAEAITTDHHDTA